MGQTVPDAMHKPLDMLIAIALQFDVQHVHLLDDISSMFIYPEPDRDEREQHTAFYCHTVGMAVLCVIRERHPEKA